MRTRKLTCPLPLRRIQLQTDYFEKSVKKSVPRWLNRLQQWDENNSRTTEYNNGLSVNTLDDDKIEPVTERQDAKILKLENI